MRRFAILLIALMVGIAELAAQQIVADGGATNTVALRNTLAAAEAAAEAGYSIKCDVNLASDGTIVVVEGPWLGEKGDPDRLNIQRSDYPTLSSKRLPNGEHIATLDDYLDKIAEMGDTELIIELKEHATPEAETTLARGVVAKVKERKMQERVDYQSSRQHICNELRRMAASSAEILYMGNNLTPEYVEGLGYTGISYTIETLKRIPRWIDEAHKVGIKVAIRGIKTAEDGKWAAMRKADIVITTAPATVSKSLK